MGRILYILARYPLWSEGFLRLDLGGLLSHGLQVKAVSLWGGDCQVQAGWPIVKCFEDNMPSASGGRQRGACCWMPPRLRMWLSLWCHRKLFQRVLEYGREEYITHVHGEFADIAGLCSAYIARKLGCSYSIGIHADDCANMKYPSSVLFDKASFITVCSERARQCFLSQCPQYAGKLCLLHHGVDLKQWKYLLHREKNDAMNILFAGRLVPKKGVDILMEALTFLPKETRLTVAGEGPERERLQKLAKQLGIDGQISWLGAVSQSALSYVFGTATCLCVPSLDSIQGRMDGIPNIVLEAMASGVPVVGFCSGGIGEVLTVVTGWPVQDTSSKALSEALLELQKNPDTVEKRRMQARRVMEENFDAERIAEKRCALFRF